MHATCRLTDNAHAKVKVCLEEDLAVKFGSPPKQGSYNSAHRQVFNASVLSGDGVRSRAPRKVLEGTGHLLPCAFQNLVDSSITFGKSSRYNHTTRYLLHRTLKCSQSTSDYRLTSLAMDPVAVSPLEQENITLRQENNTLRAQLQTANDARLAAEQSAQEYRYLLRLKSRRMLLEVLPVFTKGCVWHCRTLAYDLEVMRSSNPLPQPQQ